MRIGFVGCGAIGSCYASYLSRKHEVCVLDTYAPVVESIKKNGILLDECAPGSGTGETVSFRPAMATTDPNDGPSWKLVGMSSKASFDGTGLEPATYVWYRVECLGAAGYVSPVSDPAKVFTAPKP